MMKNGKAHSSVRTYLTVFAALAALTTVTVVLSYLGLPRKVGIGLAVLIALTKCTLIMSFFMHLRTERKAIYFIFFAAVFLALFLGCYLLPDIAFTK